MLSLNKKSLVFIVLRQYRLCIFLLMALGGCRGLDSLVSDLEVRIEPDIPLYRVGDIVTFIITLEEDGKPVDDMVLPYTLRLNDYVSVAKGDIIFKDGKASVQYTFEAPSWVLLSVILPKASNGKCRGPVLAGAICEPEKLQSGLPSPDDFESFWNDKKAALDAMPFFPELEPVSRYTDENIETYAIKLKNINGTKIQGFFAKPRGDGPFPIVMKFPAAGVFGVDPAEAASYARRGAMAIDINSHDIPNGRSEEFYHEQARGELRNYKYIGRKNRERSYFLRMFCSCYRTASYLISRPEWDGEHFVVWGSSQGGGLAFVTAGLCGEVTAFNAYEPALCDHSGGLVRRKPGWPQWVVSKSGLPDAVQLEVSQYYDMVNFARLTRAKALVFCGFIDRTCPPTSVWTAFNQLTGEKEMVNMFEIGHGGTKAFRRQQRAFVRKELGLE